MGNMSYAGLPHLYGNGEETLQRLCRVWERKCFPTDSSTSEVVKVSLIIPLIFLVPDRNFAGCAMALVSDTEAIAAITVMAGAEKSEYQSVTMALLNSAHELSSHLIINTRLWL